MTYPLPLTRRARAGDHEIAWDAWGSAADETLVICHGFSGSACDFDHLVPDLVALGVRVVLLEQRGHGRSDRTDRYALDLLADDLAAVLPQVSDRPPTLLGHSLGGRVSMAVAADHPGLLRSLVLMDTSAWSFRHPDPGTAALLEASMAAYDPDQGLPDSLPEGPEEDLVARRGDPEHLAARRQMQHRFDPHALKQLGSELLGSSHVFRHRLADITVPVTVVVGGLDEPFASQAAELAALAGGDLLVVDGAFHSPQLTHAQEWVAAVAAHLRTLVPVA